MLGYLFNYIFRNIWNFRWTECSWKIVLWILSMLCHFLIPSEGQPCIGKVFFCQGKKRNKFEQWKYITKWYLMLMKLWYLVVMGSDGQWVMMIVFSWFASWYSVYECYSCYVDQGYRSIGLLYFLNWSRLIKAKRQCLFYSWEHFLSK